MRTAEEIAKMMGKVATCEWCPFEKQCSSIERECECSDVWLAWLNGEIEVE